MNKKELSLPDILNKLIGQKVSAIKLGYGSFLTIDFGSLIEQRHTYLVGQYHLWVYVRVAY